MNEYRIMSFVVFEHAEDGQCTVLKVCMVWVLEICSKFVIETQTSAVATSKCFFKDIILSMGQIPFKGSAHIWVY